MQEEKLFAFSRPLLIFVMGGGVPDESLARNSVNAAVSFIGGSEEEPICIFSG